MPVYPLSVSECNFSARIYYNILLRLFARVGFWGLRGTWRIFEAKPENSGQWTTAQTMGKAASFQKGNKAAASRSLKVQTGSSDQAYRNHTISLAFFVLDLLSNSFKKQIKIQA